MTYGITVQARDGRWHFGPPESEEKLRASQRGAFKTAADATEASLHTEAADSLGLVPEKK